MASRRTRSATQRLAEGNSSNVTDYMGPSKRQKRALKEGHKLRPEQASPTRITRSGTVRQELSKQKPAAVTSHARQFLGSDENEEDEEEEEEVNVNFNTVVSVSNEARRTRPQTVNGVRVAEINSAPNLTVPDGGNDHEPHDGEADGEELEDSPGNRSTAHPLRRHLVRSLNSSLAKGPSQLAEQHSRELNNDDKVRGYLYEFEPSPEPPAQPAHQSSPTTALRRKANARTATTPCSKPRQQHESKMRRTTVQKVEPDDAASDSEERGGEDVAIGVGEDSVFIEAPRPDEDLATIEIIINSIGGMLKTLAHAAWTGNSRWNASFDTARGGIQGETEQCRTALGRSLMKHAKALITIFDNAAAAATYEEKGGEGYEGTIDYLRDHSDEVGVHLAGIDTLVEMICKKGLATSGDLDKRAIKARRSLLRDLAKRLIPMIILIVQTTCSLGPSEKRGGKLHLQLSSFTLQFFLRTVGWARRLGWALARGLEQWPFDPEFRKDEAKLDGGQIKSRQAKQQSRETFEKQLSLLHFKAKEAERAMQNEIQEPAREKLQQRQKQCQLDREKVLFAAKQSFQAEESRRTAKRWQAFCQSTQAFKYAPDPMKEKWDAAESARLQQQAARQTDLQEFAQHAQRGAHASSRALPAREAQGNANGASPPDQPWGLDWTEAEERTLLRAIRYHQDYHPISMAAELRRSEDDVAKKAAAIKKAYRSLYHERGSPIPGWAI